MAGLESAVLGNVGLGSAVLRRFEREKSVVITQGSGPCPVFARGDRRTAPTHWLARDMITQLEADGILSRTPRGLVLSKAAISRLP